MAIINWIILSKEKCKICDKRAIFERKIDNVKEYFCNNHIIILREGIYLEE